MYRFEREMSMERTWDEHSYTAVSRENFKGQRMNIVNCVLLVTECLFAGVKTGESGTRTTLTATEPSLELTCIFVRPRSWCGFS